MPSDPTPDLDELERRCADAEAQEQSAILSLRTPRIRALIRAARERDELRAELDALLHMPDADEMPPPTPEQERRHASIREIVLNPEMLAELRARAEKAEARAKELADVLRRHWKVIEDAAPYIPGSSFVAGEIDALESERRALAQKEPKP